MSKCELIYSFSTALSLTALHVIVNSNLIVFVDLKKIMSMQNYNYMYTYMNTSSKDKYVEIQGSQKTPLNLNFKNINVDLSFGT